MELQQQNLPSAHYKEGSEEVKIASPVTFEDDNTYSTAYTECYDPATGQIVATGEFKDVWVRSQQ